MKSSCHVLRFDTAAAVVYAAVLFAVLTARSTGGSRPNRRSRSTATPDTSGPATAEEEFASRAIIGRVNASGYAALNPRASDIIHNQNSRRLKDSQGGGYVDFSLLSQGQGAELLTINCSASCTPRETLKQIRIETTKMDILRKLRITTLPNMTNHRIPNIPFVQTLLERSSNQQNDSPYAAAAAATDSWSDNDQELESDHSTTVRTIIFPQKQSSSSSHSRLQNVVQFAFPSRVQNSEIVEATLGVHVRRSRHERPALPATLTFAFLHKVKAHGRTEVYSKKRLPLALDERGTWIQFDVRRIAREWLENPSTNYGLKIVIDDSQRRYHAVISPQNDQDELHKPYLDMSVREKASSRPRRSGAAMTCEEGGSERRCCRYPLVIDFESFRWDWIIAPRSYHAYYCSGDCPFSYIQTQHTHTRVVQQMRVDASNGGSCCSPRDLSPISLLYFDTNMNIISGVLPGMVVNRCNCA